MNITDTLEAIHTALSLRDAYVLVGDEDGAIRAQHDAMRLLEVALEEAHEEGAQEVREGDPAEPSPDFAND